ncbi:hypothetical protein [Flavobacterium hungaricum]|uniref:Lipoprotein n=1 Tax=Flavobacterium hungaricum TaxID=2082725 RepID=A0ABR9TJZ0_9FLAO|nr:hypothetical protein [Flavobacterium hungaricum]MBE8725688.1 hypothetical protein [Flavobacterium hungaricum]
MTFFLSILFSCQSNLSQEKKEKINKKEPFWKIRNQTIDKNKSTMEYPIKKDTSISNEKRSNYIYIHSADCQFEVYINDVLLTNFKGEMARKGGITGGHITNFLLLTSGTNEIKVRMYPPYGDKVFKIGAAVGLVFQHFRDGNFKTTVYDEKMRGKDGIILDHFDKQWVGDKGEYGTTSWVEGHYEPKTPLPLKGLPIYEWRSTFEAQVPYDLVGWHNSVNLEKEQEDENKNIKAELIAEYKKVHEIIKNRDVQAYLKLVKEREELLEKTMYYTEKDRKEKRKMAEELLNDGDYEIEPLFEETFQLEYQGYGKLATLLHKADGEGVIRLRNKKNPDENIYLDFLFQRKEKGGKLTVI